MKKYKAFSLLEISLTLIIIGITLTGILSIYKIILITQKNYINQKKYNYIQIAIQNYTLQHGHLPYAAQKNNGISTINCKKGYLPYKTLGINKKYSFNEDKQPFQYVVHSYLSKTNIPIIMPLTYPPKEGETSFNRVYHVQNEEIIFYDLISQIPDEILIYDDNNQSVLSKDDFFYILPPLKKFENLNQLYEWQSINHQQEKFKCKNTIAWALFSNEQYVYYQTRFDLSAQIGFPASPEPIYN